MSRRRKKKCQHCGVRFNPTAQNMDKQCYCGKAECKKASRREANKRWVKKNPDYHKGAEAVQRVRVWRAATPGYWRSEVEVLTPIPLQDDIAQMSRALHKQGRQILGTRPGVFTREQTTKSHAKTSSRHKTPTARAGPA